MTKRERVRREKARQELIDIIESFGFKRDRYGNWKRAAKNGLPAFRIKFNPLKVRFEKRIETQWEKSWVRVFSIPYGVLDQKLNAIRDYLARL